MCCSSSCSSGVISLVVVHESADIVYPLPTHSLTLSLAALCVSLCVCPLGSLPSGGVCVWCRARVGITV